MTIDVKAKVVQSFRIHLTFDDNTVKDRLVAIDDLIDVVWNGNGARKHMIGRVVAISANGSDPASWYMIVDGADDFQSIRERFSPIQVLDIEIIRKAGMEDPVTSPKGDNFIDMIRIVRGRLQYSQDGGQTWRYVKIDDSDIIEDQEGTVPVTPINYGYSRDMVVNHNHYPRNAVDDGIEDAVW